MKVLPKSTAWKVVKTFNPRLKAENKTKIPLLVMLNYIVFLRSAAKETAKEMGRKKARRAQPEHALAALNEALRLARIQ